MSDKPEAVRMADDLDSLCDPYDSAIAAELRRLHAENERLRQINQSHEMKLSVRGYEIQIDDLKALNAELVEALRKVLEVWQDDPAYGHGAADKAWELLVKIEASNGS